LYGPGGKAQTVEFIVGGKQGNTGLMPTLVPVVGQGGGGAAQAPRAGGADSSAQVRASVEQVLRDMTTPKSGKPQTEAPSSSTP
jgi:hypothetical protein